MSKIKNIMKLGRIATIYNGSTPDTRDSLNWDGEVPWITPADLKGDKYVAYGKRNITEIGVENTNLVSLPKNTVLLTSRAPIGKVALAQNTLHTNQGFKNIILDKSFMLSEFLYYYLLISEEKLNILGKGTTFKEISKSDVANLKVPCPAISIQKKIIEKLNILVEKINLIVSDTKQSIEELKKYKQSIITEAVTKGLDPNVEMKDSEIPFYGLVPKEWKVSKLGRMFEIILGKMLSPNQKGKDWTYEKYYSAANVHFSGVSDTPYKKMWFSPNEKEIYKVKIGDLLIVEGGAGAGGAAIVESLFEDTYIQNSILIVRTKGMISNKFLYYILYSLMNNGYMQYLGNVATFSHYTKEKVSKTPILIPSIKEQQKIVSRLDTQTKRIDSLIQDKEKVIEELEIYKKSLIYEYVTGKKEA